MLAPIDAFAGLLRRAGVRVSTAEVIDAARAAQAVGIAEPGLLRSALRAALIKRRGDLRTFDELFELFFVRGGDLVGGHPDDWIGHALAERGADLVDFVAEKLREQASELSPLERMILGLVAPEVGALIRNAGLHEGLERMRTPLQVGFYSYRLQSRLGIDGAVARVRTSIANLGLADADSGLLLGAAKRNADAVRDLVRRYVEDEFSRLNVGHRERLATESLVHRPLATLSPAEARLLRTEVERLAAILKAKTRLRPSRETRGRLDLGATLRRSLATDGVPFDLRVRRRRRFKPRLVILCDISDSVRHVSDFMLHFVYTLVDCFDRVEAFAFVAELGSMTDLFRDNDIDRAIELVHQGASVNVFANSNYGRMLEQFNARHMGKISSRTTVLIIGDGRTNYHAPRASVVADMRKRARRVVWLTPEGPSGWGFGDSAMAEYEHHCDEVVVAHDLDSLRRVVDQLVVLR